MEVKANQERPNIKNSVANCNEMVLKIFDEIENLNNTCAEISSRAKYLGTPESPAKQLICGEPIPLPVTLDEAIEQLSYSLRTIQGRIASLSENLNRVIK